MDTCFSDSTRNASIARGICLNDSTQVLNKHMRDASFKVKAEGLTIDEDSECGDSVESREVIEHVDTGVFTESLKGMDIGDT